MPTTSGTEAIVPPQQTAKIADGRKPNCDREQMAFADRTPYAPNCGPDCRTSSLLERRIARVEREVHQELVAALHGAAGIPANGSWTTVRVQGYA